MKKEACENFLDKVPSIKKELSWKIEDDGLVVIEVENKGLANKIAQLLLKKPKISYIHLDEVGSFIWTRIDGKLCVGDIAELLREELGSKAEPLYERLIKYCGILESYGFIEMC